MNNPASAPPNLFELAMELGRLRAEVQGLAHRLDGLLPDSRSLDSRLAGLSSQLGDLKRQMAEMEKRSGLMSASWWGRAFTVYVYVFAVQLLFGLVLVGLAYCVTGGAFR